MRLQTAGSGFMGYYTAVMILSWMALIILCIQIFENDRLPKEDKGLLALTYVLVAVAALAEWLGVRFSGDPLVSPLALRIIKCADYILTPISGGALARQLRNRGIWRKLIVVVIGINAVLQIISFFTGWMTVIDENNVYSHGVLYPVYAGLYCCIIVFVCIDFFFYGQKFRRQNRISLYASMFLLMVGILIQEILGGEFRTSYLAVTLCAALLYIHYTEFSMIAADDALQEKRVQIMLGQIQPHFLFNSLAVIRETYRTDLTRGEEAITEFAEFLRHNMDALTQERPIPFREELEYVRQYLDLQQLRFGDELNVSYEIECTEFRLPTLTLQPLVENAITYGVRKQREGNGLVTIGTRETPESYLITVSDNGPGFVPDTLPGQSERSHIGLQNVKERLKSICNGDLLVQSIPGKGTTVTMVLPKGSLFSESDSKQ